MNYLEIIDKATQAANAAGDAWIEQRTNSGQRVAFFQADLAGNKVPGSPVDYALDVCGFAYPKFTDRRSAAFKEFKKLGYASEYGSVRLATKHRGRQEWGLNEACAEAALKVFREVGIQKITLYSRID